MLRHVFVAALAAIVLSVSTASWAEEQKITTAASEQVMMAERLAALAEARNDPLLMLAALRMRSTLDDTAMPTPQGSSTTEESAACAKSMASGNDTMTAMIADVEAEVARGSDNAGYCYCFGSSCSCGHCSAFVPGTRIAWRRLWRHVKAGP